jgi:hypothetical protein
MHIQGYPTAGITINLKGTVSDEGTSQNRLEQER